MNKKIVTQQIEYARNMQNQGTGMTERFPPPPSRGLLQEALEMQGSISRAESMVDALRTLLFGLCPSEGNSVLKGDTTLASTLEDSSIRLRKICDQLESLLAKSA